MFTEPEGYNCFNMIIAQVLSNSAVKFFVVEIFCGNCFGHSYCEKQQISTGRV